MTVRVRKPAVDIVEKLSELDKPSGIAGEAMLRADTPQEQFNLIGAGRKNLLINGAMQVWQRGANISEVSFSANGADRWTSHASVNADREAFTVGQTDVPGEPKYYSRHTCVSTAMGFGQKIEDVRTGAGQYVTFSFWAKASKEISGDVLFRQRFGSGGSSTVFDDMNGEVKLDTKWRYFSFTHKYQSISAKTIGVNSFTEVGVYIPTATSGDYIDFTSVQLELGKVATPFEHRSYGEELSLCQRYYIKGYKIFYHQGVSGFTQPLPNTMRVAPSATYTGFCHTGAETQPSEVTPSNSHIYVYSTTVPSGGTFDLDAEL